MEVARSRVSREGDSAIRAGAPVPQGIGLPSAIEMSKRHGNGRAGGKLTASHDARAKGRCRLDTGRLTASGVVTP